MNYTESYFCTDLPRHPYNLATRIKNQRDSPAQAIALGQLRTEGHQELHQLQMTLLDRHVQHPSDKNKPTKRKVSLTFFWKKSPTLPPNFVHGLHKVMHSMPGAAQISCIGRGPSFAKLLQDSFKAFGLRLDNFKPFSKQPFRTNLLTKPVFDNVANFGVLPREHAKKAALMPWGPGASTLASSSNKHRITCASIVSPSCVLVCP